MPEDIVFSQSNTSTPGSRGEPPRLEMLTLCQPNELRSALECLYVSFYRDPADLERYLAPTCLQHLCFLRLAHGRIVEIWESVQTLEGDPTLAAVANAPA